MTGWFYLNGAITFNQCSSALVKKVAVCLTIKSNIAVTIRVYSILYVSLHGDWKVTLSLKHFKLASIELTKRVLSCGNIFPIKGTTVRLLS